MYLQTTPTTFYVSAAFLMRAYGIFNLATINTNNKKLLFKYFTFYFYLLHGIWLCFNAP